MRVLITGGAGFVGSSLARTIKQENPAHVVVVFDNLKRRGSELNLQVFRSLSVEFQHGDVRQKADLEALSGNFDLLIEASAEPSVHAGSTGTPDYVIETNLGGTYNCLEFCRKRGGGFIFLSTSRVYSIERLRGLSMKEGPTRLQVEGAQAIPGVSLAGIREDFPTTYPRSLYGTSKLAAELLVEEFASQFNMSAVINRCGVISGPGQFGKVDQGVFSLWVLSHLWGLPLKYTGFGGTGKQVRDLIHPRDLYGLLTKEIGALKRGSCETYNVGGGDSNSVSLLEFTGLCQEGTGRSIPVESAKATASVDIPYYVSDNAKVSRAFAWRPTIAPAEIVREIREWATQNAELLRPALGLTPR